MGKYKIRKRKKPLNPMLVFLVFGTCMFLVACGYALFSDYLEIDGTANFKPVGQEDEASMLQIGDVFTPTPEINNYSSSKYTYETISNWQQGDGTYIYQVNLEITNLEEDFTSGNIEVAFEEINGLFEEQSQENLGITQAEKVLISGNRITILFTEVNSVVKYGDKINILVYLTYENEQPEGITIQNVTLNGMYLSKDTTTPGNEDESDNESDEESKNEVNTNTQSNTVDTNTVGNTVGSENLNRNKTDDNKQSENENNQFSGTQEKDGENEEP